MALPIHMCPALFLWWPNYGVAVYFYTLDLVGHLLLFFWSILINSNSEFFFLIKACEGDEQQHISVWPTVSSHFCSFFFFSNKSSSSLQEKSKNLWESSNTFSSRCCCYKSDARLSNHSFLSCGAHIPLCNTRHYSAVAPGLSTTQNDCDWPEETQTSRMLIGAVRLLSSADTVQWSSVSN